jgi:hypothetical protein
VANGWNPQRRIQLPGALSYFVNDLRRRAFGCLREQKFEFITDQYDNRALAPDRGFRGRLYRYCS